MSADFPSPTLDTTASQARPRPSSLARPAAWAATAILLGLTGVHSYWAAGGEWATDPNFLPRFDPLVTSGVACILLVAAAALLLARVGVPIVTLPRPLLRVGPGALCGAFAVIGLTNVLVPPMSPAADWQIYFFGPLLWAVAALCAIIAAAEPGPE